jgi:ERCC4-type nuclease
MNNIVQVVDRHGQQLNVNQPGQNDVGFEHGPWMQRRNYRDSAYAVMAAMYSLLHPDVHHQVKTAQVESEMRHFTDHDVRYDYRVRRQGAFKAMDQLVETNLVYKQRGTRLFFFYVVRYYDNLVIRDLYAGFGGSNCYSLTERGLKVCYQLFHVKFTPQISPAYALVRPRGGQCEATEQGQIRALYGRGGAIAMPPLGMPGDGGGWAGRHHPAAAASRGAGVAAAGLPNDPLMFNGMGNDDDDEGFGYGGGYGGRYDGMRHSPLPRPHGGASAGGSAAGQQGRKRPVEDSYDDSDHGDEPVYELDADLVRLKRLQKFARPSSSVGGRRQNTGVGMTKSASAPLAHAPLLGGISAGPSYHPHVPYAAPPARSAEATAVTDSQDPDLEAVRLQTLLEYSEAEAAREAARRKEEQELEDMQLQAVLADSAHLQQLHDHHDYETDDAASEQSVYDLDFEPPAEWELAPGAEEGLGYSSGSEDEDYRRAVDESLRSRPSSAAEPSASTPAVAAADRAVKSAVRTAVAGAPAGSASVKPSCATPSAQREVISLEDVDYTPLRRGHSTLCPSSGAVNLHNRVVVDCTRPDDATEQTVRATSVSKAQVSVAQLTSPDSEVQIVDPPASVPASSRKVTADRHADSQDSARSAASCASASRGKGYGAAAASRGAYTPQVPPTAEVEELSSGTPPVRSTRAPPPSTTASAATGLRPAGSPKRASAAAPPREVISLLDSQSQSQLVDEFCLEEVDGWALVEGAVDGKGRSARENEGDAVGSGRAMLAAFSALKQTGGDSSSATVSPRPHRVQLPPLPVTALPLSTANTQCLMSSQILCTAVPTQARRQLVMLVDTRERREQNRYRQFYFDIQQRCVSHLPPSPLTLSGPAFAPGGGMPTLEWRTEQEELKLGDVAFAYESPGATASAAPATDATKQHTAHCWLTGTIVERKALGDLIGSSAGDTRERCGTARHVTQERRLRHSGLSAPFMLIEGMTSAPSLHAVPLVWRESDHSNPDVIDGPEGIVSYMCSVVARNYAPQCRVRVLQTMNTGSTVVLYAALMAVELYRAAAASKVTVADATAGASCPTLEDFDKYCTSLGGDKRGLEAQLRKDLLLSATPAGWDSQASSGGTGVSVEMIERVVRRFGIWDALLSAYRMCYSADSDVGDGKRAAGTALAELRCAMLLCELTVGGTHLDRQALAASYEAAGLGAVDDTNETATGCSGGMSVRDSALVWLAARRKLVAQGFLQLPSGAGDVWEAYLCSVVDVLSPRKVSKVVLSDNMAATYMSEHTALDARDFIVDVPSAATAQQSGARVGKAVVGGTASYVNCQQGWYPYLRVHTVDNTEYAVSSGAEERTVLRRRSLGMVVAVVSGFDVVEALVLATDAYCSTLAQAVHGNVFADPSHSIPIVRGALSRLATRLPAEFTQGPTLDTAAATAQRVLLVEGLVHPTSSMASATGRLSRAVNTSGVEDTEVTLGEGRVELPLRAAREVSANEGWLVQLLLAYTSVCGGEDCTVAGVAAGRGPEGEAVGHGWQCLLAPNAEQTERMLYSLVHEAHRQALLLYCSNRSADFL